MALILNIESSTTNCSVALARNGVEVSSRSINDGYSHAEKLAPFVNELLNETENAKQDLSAIAISEGPGSYTGLRIGTSLAKGLCYSMKLPLIAIPTLETMCASAKVQDVLSGLNNPRICPMLDARRLEVYTAMYDLGMKEIMPLQPLILEEGSFADVLSENAVVFFGNGSNKFAKICRQSNAHFIPDVWPDARNMCNLSQNKFDGAKFEDVAYFEPNYLKAFQATTPKKLL